MTRLRLLGRLRDDSRFCRKRSFRPIKVFEDPRNFFQKVPWWGMGRRPIQSLSPNFDAGQGLEGLEFFGVLLFGGFRHGGTDGADHEVFGGVFGIDQLGDVDGIAGGLEALTTEGVGQSDSQLLLQKGMLQDGGEFLA